MYSRFLAIIFSFFFLLPISEAEEQSAIWLLTIDSAITPATADYIVQALTKAQTENVALVVLTIDTPGGLDLAMREIIQAILVSAIPVVSYVHPAGARAASAGTYILYASHIAAMSPATNLGAATPVQLGELDNKTKQVVIDTTATPTTTKSNADTLHDKMVNDADAYLQSLATLRERNAIWASKAVRESASLSAEEALKENVIDLMATDINDLLKKLQGREVKVLGEVKKLETEQHPIKIIDPNWRNQLLSIVTNPNIAYLLMLLGIYGVFFELSSPGSVLPGVLGGIAILLALFAFQVLPINYAGVGLILLGIAFMVAEAFFPSFILGLGGVVAFVMGSIMLMDTDLPYFAISPALIGGLALVSTLFFIWVIKMSLQIRTQPIITGQEAMIGAIGECISHQQEQLRVFVHSEMWNAQATQPIQQGQTVRVIARKGLLLTVEPINITDNK